MSSLQQETCNLRRCHLKGPVTSGIVTRHELITSGVVTKHELATCGIVTRHELVTNGIITGHELVTGVVVTRHGLVNCGIVIRHELVTSGIITRHELVTSGAGTRQMESKDNLNINHLTLYQHQSTQHIALLVFALFSITSYINCIIGAGIIKNIDVATGHILRLLFHVNQ